MSQLSHLIGVSHFHEDSFRNFAVLLIQFFPVALSVIFLLVYAKCSNAFVSNCVYHLEILHIYNSWTPCGQYMQFYSLLADDFIFSTQFCYLQLSDSFKINKNLALYFLLLKKNIPSRKSVKNVNKINHEKSVTFLTFFWFSSSFFNFIDRKHLCYFLRAKLF